MDLLSRTEEIMLLTIWNLENNAYGITISEKLTETTGRKWRLGAVYVTLERLEKKGYVESFLGNATSKRGGRRKRIYKVSKIGLENLVETRDMAEHIWKNVSVGNLRVGYE
ncbi:MAG: PadR family transcriptional regulator [bacterium]|nr:PadR family transcriptional regulator [bacterium]